MINVYTRLICIILIGIRNKQGKTAYKAYYKEFKDKRCLLNLDLMQFSS